MDYYPPVSAGRNSTKSTQNESEVRSTKDKEIILPIIEDTLSQKVDNGNKSVMGEVASGDFHVLKQEFNYKT